MTQRHAVTAIALAIMLAACGADADSAIELDLEPLNASGVSGTVTLSAIDEATILVTVEVDPAGHASMPAHVHPGSCEDLVPQPRYALENVVDGSSSTEVPASLDELLAGGQALNLHRSNGEMDVYTACVDLVDRR